MSEESEQEEEDKEEEDKEEDEEQEEEDKEEIAEKDQLMLTKSNQKKPKQHINIPMKFAYKNLTSQQS